MMRNFSDEEYVKMFRKLVFWEWYTDVNTTKLFLHCLGIIDVNIRSSEEYYNHRYPLCYNQKIFDKYFFLLMF